MIIYQSIITRPTRQYAVLMCILALLALILGSISGFTQEEDKTTSKYFQLDNGLKVFLYKREALPLLHLSFAVNIGSKDESDETSGLVHILEHYILFQGTEFREGREIALETRQHGAYFNAHTGRDIAIFEISLPSEHADFALKNQKEILFHLKLTQENLDKEKKVILEELSQLYDDPLKYATSIVYQNLFRNHPYHNPIYGNKEIIEAITVQQVEDFYKKYFVPSNCALAIVGSFDLADMEEKIKEMFKGLSTGTNTSLTSARFHMVFPLKKPIEIEHQMDVNQAYMVIGTLAPDYNSQDQYAADLLTEILGSGINPMLNYPLRGRRELVYTVSMGYSAYKYGGAMLIYLTLDPKNINAAKRETIRFLKTTRQQNYSKKDFYGESQFHALDYLEYAKNQMKFNYHKSQENGLAIANSLARYMLLNTQPQRGGYLENIDKIRSSDLRNVAGNYLSKGNFVIVTIRPKNKKQ